MTETTDNLEAVRRDIIALAQAVKLLNDYGSRIGQVNALCLSILAPSPHEARAQEDLAALTAKTRSGVVAIIADWDDNWHFMFQFRFTDGWWTGDGFDLREGTPGFNALLKALDFIKVSPAICDLSAPAPARAVPVRRVIYPKDEEVKPKVDEVKEATKP